MGRKEWLLVGLVVALVVGSMALGSVGRDAAFDGTDGQATAAITAGHPDYEPWFASVWTPPSSSMESLLFALQAALGAGFLGFYIGLRKGQAGRRERTADGPPA